ncbi:MAG: hypothetical protein HY905_18135 [Deltaproteobacteria bacterium]|nr:hypothetical protein [Deltaproteobacteria bacterium]
MMRILIACLAFGLWVTACGDRGDESCPGGCSACRECYLGVCVPISNCDVGVDASDDSGPGPDADSDAAPDVGPEADAEVAPDTAPEADAEVAPDVRPDTGPEDVRVEDAARRDDSRTEDAMRDDSAWSEGARDDAGGSEGWEGGETKSSCDPVICLLSCGGTCSEGGVCVCEPPAP